MKASFVAVAAVIASSALSLAAPSATSSVAAIRITAGAPSLIVKNARIDPRDGKVRGIAYVSFGYATPRAAHVHAYGLNAAGVVVAEGCDNLSGNLLAPHPRRAGKGRDAFGIELSKTTSSVRSIRIVAHSGKSDC